MLYVGCHLSASGGNLQMVKTAESIGANTFAFFTRNPRGSKAKPEDPADSAAAVAARKEKSFGRRGDCFKRPQKLYHEFMHRRCRCPGICLRDFVR